MTLGWTLDRDDRERLLAMLPPRWPDRIAEHITGASGKAEDDPLLPEIAARIVGQVDDGEGVQAMVVTVDGGTRRPDGGIYHITWSLDRSRGREAMDSNDVIARLGWQPVDPAVPIAVTPARWVWTEG